MGVVLWMLKLCIWFVIFDYENMETFNFFPLSSGPTTIKREYWFRLVVSRLRGFLKFPKNWGTQTQGCQHWYQLTKQNPKHLPPPLFPKRRDK